MGRSVMTSLAVKEYLEGENPWKEALARLRGKEDWLEDITGEKQSHDDEDDEHDGSEKKKGRHKKDKKKKKKRRHE